MRKAYSVLALAGLAMGASTPVLAQEDAAPILKGERGVVLSGTTDNLGDPVAGPYEVETGAGDNRCLGVEYAWGFIWISGTGLVPAAGSQRIHKFSPTGTFIASYNQVTNSPGVAFWGGRDGAADETGNKLYFGAEAGELSEYSFDPTTGAVTHVRLIATGVPFVIRALARNPANGHFYSGDFSTPIYEFTIDPPTIVNTFPNNANGGAALAYYGFAWDEVDGTLWGWSQNGPAPAGNPANQRVLATELNPATMQGTGRSFFGVVHPPTAPATQNNIAGGADIICNHPSNPGKLSLITVHQALMDAVFIYDLATNCGGPTCYPDCNGDHALNVNDFVCFQAAFAGGNMALADCNHDLALNVNDFVCFQSAFAAGCSAP